MQKYLALTVVVFLLPASALAARCDTSVMKERSEQTLVILKALGETVNVPFYRFRWRYYLDASEQEKLMIEVQEYVDSMPVVSP